MEELSVSDFGNSWGRISGTVGNIVYGKRYAIENGKPQELWKKEDIGMDEFWCAMEEELLRIVGYNRSLRSAVHQVLSIWTYPDYNETNLDGLLDRITTGLPKEVQNRVDSLLSRI